MRLPTVGISMVRDEADVIEGTLLHMAEQVDLLIVANNLSVDATPRILARLQSTLPLVVIDDPDPGYYQSDKMTYLARRAAAMHAGGLYVVPFDADELWTGVDGRRVRDVLADLDHPVAGAQIINHFRTAADEPHADPFRSMVWRQADPQELGKVAFRWEPGSTIHQGNHGVTLPTDPDAVPAPVLSIRHFPYRSGLQMVSKARNGASAYAATTLPEDMGDHWRSYGRILAEHGDDALLRVFHEHFWYADPGLAGLVRDPAPYRSWGDEFAPSLVST